MLNRVDGSVDGGVGAFFTDYKYYNAMMAAANAHNVTNKYLDSWNIVVERATILPSVL